MNLQQRRLKIMEAIKGWEEVKASGDYERLPNGAYICTIINAEDNKDGQYLNIEFDITAGDKEYLQFASNAYKNLSFWILSMVRSYKESAHGMLKRFVNDVEKSNDGYTWNWDESTLEGKDIGCVICTEHYWKNNGDEGLRYKVKNTFPIDEIDKYKDKKYEDMYAKDFDAKKNNDSFEQAETENPFAEF